VPEEAGSEGHTVETLDSVEGAAVDDKRVRHLVHRSTRDDADNDEHVTDEADRGADEQKECFVNIFRRYIIVVNG